MSSPSKTRSAPVRDPNSEPIIIHDANTPAEPEPMGFVEIVATVGSIILLLLTFPISLFVAFKVSNIIPIS